jgi:hypothetical protein
MDGKDGRREQFAGAGAVLGTSAAGEQAIVADAVEACGQHMHEEAADELMHRQGHQLVTLTTFAPVVLPLEGEAPFVRCEQAAIGDGDAMGVARDISQDFVRAAEWEMVINLKPAKALGLKVPNSMQLLADSLAADFDFSRRLAPRPAEGCRLKPRFGDISTP